jgi:hypothetical protein
MSQRRQEARKAAQQRRREQRQATRVQQQRRKQSGTATAPRSAVTQPAAPVKRARDPRIMRYALIAAGAVVVLALVFWLVIQQRKPLPGERFDTNGNQHVAPSEAHGSYFTNPPTSGWHYPSLPNPGVYTQAFPPEGLPHLMEHGGVWVLYTCPDGCDDLANQLKDIVIKATDRNRPVALAPYPLKGNPAPEHKINVIAWQYKLSLDEFDQGKINEFIDRHSCRYSPEGGPWCSGVKGKTAPEKDAGPSGVNAATAAAAATATFTITAVSGTPTPAPVGPTPAPTTAGTATVTP